ncbi:MAG: hypothetical protein OQJ82_05155, partial [Sulfurimonas sp.]|nr:hypothetical protein [Sulfurimonas sp.]
MKKILLLSVLAASICFAEDSFAEHEAKMQQIQERSMNQNNQGSGEKKQNRYRKGNENAGSSGPQDGTGNQYKGSKGG